MDSPHKSASQIVGIVATLDLLRSDELVNVLHGDDGGLAVEIDDQKLLALLVGELLSSLNGLLLSDVEEPIFEENDNFFPYFVCYLKINVYICGRKVPCLCWIVVPAVTWGFFIFSEILGYWHYLRYYRE